MTDYYDAPDQEPVYEIPFGPNQEPVEVTEAQLLGLVYRGIDGITADRELEAVANDPEAFYYRGEPRAPSFSESIDDGLDELFISGR